MDGKDLLLFTTAFPYDTITETTFVMAELPYLCKEFRRVIIVPEIAKGEMIDLSEFKNVIVDTSRSESIDHRHPICKLGSALHPSVISQTISSLPYAPLHKWPAAWSMAINRHRIGRNLRRIISRHNIDCDKAVFYTFWFDHVTEAIALTLPESSGILVSCAHGHDIYPYPRVLKINKFRNRALKRMSRLYAASTGGAEHLRQAYPEHALKITTRTLGSIKLTHTAKSRPHNDSDTITFFSCSRVDDNKRVTLNYRLLNSLASRFPAISFKWIHIGDGDRMPALKAETSQNKCKNLSIILKGACPNHEVHDTYTSEPIDWVILFSSCEGNPIALAEALSYGVPVVTCDVPGCREIIDDNVGMLLSANPIPEEFISRISPYINGEKEQSPLREAAYERWCDSYDASKLRADFAKELASLRL